MEKVSAAAKANLASGDVGAVTDMLGKLGATYVSQPSEPQSPQTPLSAAWCERWRRGSQKL